MRHSGLVGAGRKIVLKRFSSNSVIVLLFFMDFVCVFAVVLRVVWKNCSFVLMKVRWWLLEFCSIGSFQSSNI